MFWKFWGLHKRWEFRSQNNSIRVGRVSGNMLGLAFWKFLIWLVQRSHHNFWRKQIVSQIRNYLVFLMFAFPHVSLCAQSRTFSGLCWKANQFEENSNQSNSLVLLRWDSRKAWVLYTSNNFHLDVRVLRIKNKIASQSSFDCNNFLMKINSQLTVGQINTAQLLNKCLKINVRKYRLIVELCWIFLSHMIFSYDVL